MLLKQQFKTLEGASKRAAFENAHCQNRYRFTIVWCRNGVPNKKEEWTRDNHTEFTWQLEKVRR